MYESPCQGVCTTYLSLVDHCGTHVDAPFHFLPQGRDISRVEPEKLMGPGVLIDASKKHTEEPVTAGMLEEQLQMQGDSLTEGDIVLIRCWPHEWGTEGYFACGALDTSAADFLIEKKVKAVGVDTISVDCLEDKRRPVHLKLLQEEIIPIETLVNLHLLPRNNFEFIALPLPLKGGSASPVRAVAVLK